MSSDLGPAHVHSHRLSIISTQARPTVLFSILPDLIHRLPTPAPSAQPWVARRSALCRSKVPTTSESLRRSSQIHSSHPRHLCHLASRQPALVAVSIGTCSTMCPSKRWCNSCHAIFLTILWMTESFPRRSVSLSLETYISESS